ncbi:MAG: hypothetical protein ACJA2N_001733 [Salibacteraceae bacterium]|jgi:hypothetical protein
MRNPVFEVELALFFRGSRDYIYAADIYSLSAQAIFTNLKVEKIENVDFSVHKMTNKGLTLKVFNTPVEIEGYCAKFNFEVQNELFFGLVVENASLVQGSVLYDEKFITDKSSIDLENKSIQLNRSLEIPFLDVCTAMNKYMHENVFPEIKGKWVSVRIQLELFSKMESYHNLCVKNRKIFGKKYTQNSIFMNDEKRGFIYFSIV